MSEETRIFDFDRILGVKCKQDESFDQMASNIVNDVMQGYNGTIMAYGQTGSGKSYTIFGKKASMEYHDDLHEDMGIVPRAVKLIFNKIRDSTTQATFQVRVAFMQVYMEQISDLIPDNEEFGNNPGANTTSPSPMVFTKNNKINYNLKDGLQIREDPKTGIFVKGQKQIVYIFL